MTGKDIVMNNAVVGVCIMFVKDNAVTRRHDGLLGWK